MDVLMRARALFRLSLGVVPACVAIGGLGAGCNALVGVDFGSAHLADGGLSDGPPLIDAHMDARTDAGMDAKASDATSDATDAGFEGGCNPAAAPSAESCVITEAYGVFVAPAPAGSDTTGDGSRAAPYATLSNAVAHAAGKRVYACAATFPEQLAVTAASDGVGVYGGLSCPTAPAVIPDAGGTHDAGDAASDASPVDAAHEAGGPDATPDTGSDASEAGVDAGPPPWVYTGVKTVVSPGVAGYALQVEQLAVGAHFEDMAFHSQSPSAAVGGGSSIAAMVNGSTGVSFVHVDFHAQNGLAGSQVPFPSPNWCTTSLAGFAGSNSGPGALETCTCPVSGSSTGGEGVPSTHATAAVNAGTATPTPPSVVAPDDGLPGASSTIVGACTTGDPGAPGAAGAAGAAGGPGAIAASGWTVSAGGDGTAGGPGQGGGGGGSVGTATPAGGGGGGVGGCGGSGGHGGSPGGASIAVAIVASHVTFSVVTLETGVGGAGGPGGVGEGGQTGGPGGGVQTPGQACAGGGGGPGGGGGGGGGGAGGPSAGVAWTGTPPTFDGMVLSTASTLPSPSSFVGAPAGVGGAGGPGGAAALSTISGSPGAPGPSGISGAIVPF